MNVKELVPNSKIRYEHTGDEINNLDICVLADKENAYSSVNGSVIMTLPETEMEKLVQGHSISQLNGGVTGFKMVDIQELHDFAAMISNIWVPSAEDQESLEEAHNLLGKITSKAREILQN